jgi:hypothetical protein
MFFNCLCAFSPPLAGIIRSLLYNKTAENKLFTMYITENYFVGYQGNSKELQHKNMNIVYLIVNTMEYSVYLHKISVHSKFQ